VIRQLVVQGHLRVDEERYGALVLTEASRPLLRGEIAVRLREDPKDSPAKKKGKPATGASSLSDDDRELFDRLRELRKRIASEQSVPPYVIFHDATLLAMAVDRPKSPAQMLALNGVGKAKLEKYGDAFLRELGAQAGEI
jgi:ATP-dependent DNA helicase RecQ